MPWGAPTTPPSTWTGRADARIAELEQQLERALDAYQTLWHLHHAHLRRDEETLRLTNEHRRLPSPHELRTGQTPLGVLADYANRCPDEVEQP